MRKNYILLLIAMIFIITYAFYHSRGTRNQAYHTIGETHLWRVEAQLVQSKEVYIFRPVLYPKTPINPPFEVEVTWQLDPKLTYFNENSPQLNTKYTSQKGQEVVMADLPLQHFNFSNPSRKEVMELLSKSSIKIEWQQDQGEFKKEEIKLKVKK